VVGIIFGTKKDYGGVLPILIGNTKLKAIVVFHYGLAFLVN
jgi:hypothetical protein|tara:strand:- start:808 stop:930 length:123 start_codon:yes stop_codon:yes gene_type:complete